MWPRPGEGLDRHVRAELAVENLYGVALQRWLPIAQSAALPALTAATLPPDLNAVDDQTATDQWTTTAEAVVIAGVALLWTAAVVEALDGIGIPLPELPTIRSGNALDVEHVDQAVLNTVLASVDMTVEALSDAFDRVQNDAALTAAREDFLATQRERAAEVPVLVREQVVLALGDDTPLPTGVPNNEGAVVNLQRDIVELAMDPAGPDMADIARTAGYQAAAVQNHAIVTAADTSEDDLEKTWIATLDSRTRNTHWAADGQRTPLAGTFAVGSAQLLYPADPAGPPSEVINCRCRVGVLAPDEALPNEVDRHTERLNGRDSTARNRQGSQADEKARREADGIVRAREDPDGIGRTASAAPSEQEYDMTSSLAAADETATSETFRTFTDAVIALVGEPTSDGRMLAEGIDLSMRTFPHPLMWCEQTGYGHEDAYTVGVVEAARLDNGRVLASGYVLNTPDAERAVEQLGHRVTSPSVDLAQTDWVMTDRSGAEIDYDDYIASIEAGEPIELYQTVLSAELIGTTLVATAAFGDTSLVLNAERESRDLAVVASAVAEFRPRVYAADLFANPNLVEPTRTTMDPDTGRIFGHLACFGECHRSIQAECVVAPRNGDDYGEFHTSPPVMLDNGTRLAVGRLTVGTGHAPGNLRGQPAAAHYDNTGTCWALVRIYEDQHGIAFSGVAAPWATAEQIEQGLGSPLSGDWRDYGAGLRLTAVLSVNTPGFNTARGWSDATGRPTGLVASLQPPPAVSTPVTALSIEDIRTAVREELRASAVAAELAVARDAALAAANAITTPPTPAEAIGAMLAELDA